MVPCFIVSYKQSILIIFCSAYLKILVSHLFSKNLQILEIDVTKDEKGKKVPEFFIHFMGWNKRFVLKKMLFLFIPYNKHKSSTATYSLKLGGGNGKENLSTPCFCIDGFKLKAYCLETASNFDKLKP